MPQDKLDPLRSNVDRLKALLDDPQPGLMTWNEAVGKRWEAISEMWRLGIPDYLKEKGL
jgi:hypothetical protein